MALLRFCQGNEARKRSVPAAQFDLVDKTGRKHPSATPIHARGGARSERLIGSRSVVRCAAFSRAAHEANKLRPVQGGAH